MLSVRSVSVAVPRIPICPCLYLEPITVYFVFRFSQYNTPNHHNKTFTGLTDPACPFRLSPNPTQPSDSAAGPSALLTSPQPTSRSPNPSQQRRNYGAFAARSPVWSAVAAAEAAAPKTRAWRYFILFFFIILVFQFFPCAVMAAAAWSTEQFADPSHSPRHATRALAPVLILTHPLRQGWWRGTMLADRGN